MSKITNDGLTRCDTVCCIAVHMATVLVERLIVNIVDSVAIGL